MYYESIRTLLEEEFLNKDLNEEQKFRGLDLLNKLSENFHKITNSKPLFIVASLAFFVLNESENSHSFRSIGEQFGVEPKTLALKVKEMLPFLEIENHEDVLKKGLMASSGQHKTVAVQDSKKGEIVKLIQQELISIKKRISTTESEFNDKELVEIFKSFKNFLELIFKDKDFIEIKQFLKLLELNLYMAGFDIKKTNLEKKFGDLFIYLGFEPKKGREAEKFVNLKDRFGKTEPYTLIKLGD